MNNENYPVNQKKEEKSSLTTEKERYGDENGINAERERES
jgi:hypothetical protein